MSIQALVGLPGHGKSYSAVELFILTALKQNRKILTNIPLKLDVLAVDFPDYDFEQNFRYIDLEEWKSKPAQFWADKSVFQPSALYLLDELWRIWPQGLKTLNIPTHQLAFIKEHRHNIDETGREPDIVLVTQNLSDIANAIRDMVETTIVCCKLTEVGKKNAFRRDYYRGVVKGFTGPKASFIRSDSYCKYQPTVYQYYKSHTKAEGDAHVIDNSGVVTATIFNGLGFKIGLGFLIFLILAIVYLSFRTKSGIEQMQKNKQTDVVPDSAALVAAAQPQTQKEQEPEKPKPPQESKRFRLTGRFVQGQVIKWFLVSDGSQTRRIEPAKCQIGLNDVCLVDGEIVTAYTGSSPSLLASMPFSGFSTPKPNSH
jgi:zona occludens toxin